MNKKEIEEIEKHNKYIMERMHPAVMIPGFLMDLRVLLVGYLKDKMVGYELVRS